MLLLEVPPKFFLYGLLTIGALSFALGVLLLTTFLKTWWSGILTRKKEEAAFERHSKEAKKILWIVLAIPCLLEVPLIVFPWNDPHILWFRAFHFECFVIPTIALYLLGRVFTGKQFPQLHRWIMHPCVAFGVCMCLTGLYLNCLLLLYLDRTM